MKNKIIFGGRVFKRVSDMPPDLRDHYYRVTQFFQDEDFDGIPDLIQSKGFKGINNLINFAKEVSQISEIDEDFNPDMITTIKITDSYISVNGKRFNHLADMPSDIRAVFERLVHKADPGELEELINMESERVWENQHSPPLNEAEFKMIYKQALTRPILSIMSTKMIILATAVIAIALCGLSLWLITSGILP